MLEWGWNVTLTSLSCLVNYTAVVVWLLRRSFHLITVHTRLRNTETKQHWCTLQYGFHLWRQDKYKHVVIFRCQAMQQCIIIQVLIHKAEMTTPREQKSETNTSAELYRIISTVVVRCLPNGYQIYKASERHDNIVRIYSSLCRQHSRAPTQVISRTTGFLPEQAKLLRKSLLSCSELMHHQNGLHYLRVQKVIWCCFDVSTAQ